MKSRTLLWSLLGSIGLCLAAIFLSNALGQPAATNAAVEQKSIQTASSPAFNPGPTYPEFQAAQQAVTKLQKQYVAAADEKAKAEIRKQLEELVGKQFDQQRAQQQKELADLEAQLKRLQELAKKRDAVRQEIINRRLEQLIHESEGLGWLPPSPRPGWADVQSARPDRVDVRILRPARTTDHFEGGTGDAPVSGGAEAGFQSR